MGAIIQNSDVLPSRGFGSILTINRFREKQIPTQDSYQIDSITSQARSLSNKTTTSIDL